MSRIPKILHYCFGFSPDFGGKPWSLVHYACLRSAIALIEPDEVNFYYEHEPTGPWWALTRPLVRLRPITAPREIFGKPLDHVAHRADIVRLERLIEQGGVYLDADVLMRRPIDDLLDNSVVLAREGDHGLANAVIFAEPNAPFLRRWYEEYRSFRGAGREQFWNEHSVEAPARLAAEHPETVTVLGPQAFYWPLWSKEHLAWIFTSDEPIPGDSRGHHLWESLAWEHLRDLTPGQVRATDTNFNRWVRPYVADLPAHYGRAPLLRRLRSRAGKLRRGLARRGAEPAPDAPVSRREAFQAVYRDGLWGGDGASAFFSGVGSRGEAPDRYVEAMAELLNALQARQGRPITIVDLGCGDFAVGGALLARVPDARYIGCDIVPELVAHNQARFGDERTRFVCLDAVTDAIPPGDVCLVRQVLQHLSNADIAAILPKLTHDTVYVSEGHPTRLEGPPNPDKTAGSHVRFDWRKGVGRGVDLDAAPYGLRVEEVLSVQASPTERIVTVRLLGRAST